jgi:hypothetical protein
MLEGTTVTVAPTRPLESAAPSSQADRGVGAERHQQLPPRSEEVRGDLLGRDLVSDA